MYDLVPPSMKAQFNLINLPNQSIKLSVNISIKSSKKKGLAKYSYNKIVIFKYLAYLKNSQFILDLYTESLNPTHFYKSVVGSFLYDFSIKNSISEIVLNSENKLDLNPIVYGFLQKDFVYSFYKHNSKKSKFKTSFKLSKKYSTLLKSLNFLKELVSEPSNVIYPVSFAKRTLGQIDKKNINVKILKEKELKKIGLNCLLAVSQGSQREPIVMEFSKKNTKKNVDILFVGKGVCFDSGGISIKPSGGMEDMKWDMAGSAVTASIMKYLSEIKTNFSYAGIVGLVENMPSGTAYKPGDIIKSYKGINVEVLNTDAEGRLVLADIITYGCEKYKPKIIIDFATLTGAIMVALGQHYSGLFCNDDKLAEVLYQSGIDTNEKVWRMPLHDDFDKELNSPFVDLKNIGAGRYGGSVTAAQFLQRFVPKDTIWAHLDIAGTTWKNAGDIMNNKGSTGFGLTLIADFISKYFKN
jgi:leucyl aminopeptidase